MIPKLEETICCDFITSSPTTGAAADADSLPTCEVFEDTTDTAILTPTVASRTGKTGNYRISIACTAANGFEAGKSYNIVVSATVGGVAAKAVVQRMQVRTQSLDSVADAVWAKTMTELSAVPGVTASTLSALQWLFVLSRNKVTQTANTQTVRNDADSATIATSTVGDDGTTFTRGEFG
jgi:hypothetical protein